MATAFYMYHEMDCHGEAIDAIERALTEEGVLVHDRLNIAYAEVEAFPFESCSLALPLAPITWPGPAPAAAPNAPINRPRALPAEQLAT